MFCLEDKMLSTQPFLDSSRVGARIAFQVTLFMDGRSCKGNKANRRGGSSPILSRIDAVIVPSPRSDASPPFHPNIVPRRKCHAKTSRRGDPSVDHVTSRVITRALLRAACSEGMTCGAG